MSLSQPLVFRPDRCTVIGEVAQAHDGSLGLAHAFIDAIAAAGADAVKFQTHFAEAESTPAEPWRLKFSYQDDTRFDYWKRTSFSEPQWAGLVTHAHDRGLLFISSPFSRAAVDLLARVGTDVWKVASGEVGHRALVDAMCAAGGPVLLSSGMSDLSELDAAVAMVRAADRPTAVMQCTTAYPCPPEQVGLNMLSFFRERYGTPVGLSDHSGAIYAGLAAVTLGIEVLEVHVTLSREMFGPDVSASVTTAELRQLVDGTRAIERMKGHPVDKDDVAVRMDPLRRIFGRSVTAARALRAGTRLTAADLALKKPGTGLAEASLPSLVGRLLRRDLVVDELLQSDDVEPPLDGVETVSPTLR
ncbi:MAG: N-acetylneuraminate synthase family protein [Vicinamibacterales bacterium]